MNKTKILGAVLLVIGLALLAWVLYDASDIVAKLGLEGVVGEAVVAMVALMIAALSLAGSAALFFRNALRAEAR